MTNMAWISFLTEIFIIELSIPMIKASTMTNYSVNVTQMYVWYIVHIYNTRC